MSTIVNLQYWKGEHPQSHDSKKKLFLTESPIKAYPEFKDSCLEEIIKFRSYFFKLRNLPFKNIITR